jgi:hypothetical protein
MPKTQQGEDSGMAAYEPPDVPQGEAGSGSNAKPKDEKPDPPKRINLFRFLQIKPQNNGIQALLLAKKGNEVKTISEWEIALKDLLAKKVK